jgi:hypothetical protein
MLPSTDMHMEHGKPQTTIEDADNNKRQLEKYPTK